MKTLLQIEMYYVREYSPTCRFLKIINSTLTDLVDYFLESTIGVYSPLHNESGKRNYKSYQNRIECQTV